MERTTRSRPALAAAVLAALLALAGCGGTAGSGATASGGTMGDTGRPEPAQTLDGRTFLSTGVTKDGADAPLVPGSRISLFFGDQLGVQPGCNSMGASWSLDGDALVVGEFTTTLIGCPPDLGAQDQWVSEFLTARPAVRLDGTTLTLTGGGRVLTLQDKEVATPDLPVEGTLWTLDSIGEGTGPDSTVGSVPAGVTSTLQLADGRASVRPGCNRGSASATLDGDRLTLGPLALTRMACGEDATRVESAVVAVLSGTVTVAVDADVLTVTGPTGFLSYRGTPS